MLRFLWKHRHRAFRSMRRLQGWLGDMLARLPLPVSAKIILGDLCFIACDSFIFHTQTYQAWKKNRISRGRLHALFTKDTKEEVTCPPPAAPDRQAWNALRAPRSENPKVDVIVPVYNGYETTLRCLYSVLASQNATPFKLIVINDASTDNALTAMLYELAGRDFFVLLENKENKGFVATANRGMQLHPTRDVVLLNADTEVYGNWLDRLCAHASRHEKTGSVTPLSNNAGICSYPAFLQNNPVMPELDALAAKANAGASCTLPTAVGFCMYIPRACLNAVGYFDEATFGRGYGEENDFCLRASRQGFTHLLAADIYVAHVGGVSFAQEKAPREKAAWKLLKRRYPEYAGQVAAFVTGDPALPLRRVLDVARLAQKKRARNVLMISHAAGGGTEKHIRERLSSLEKEEDTGGFILTPVTAQPGMLALSHPDIASTPNLLFSLDEEQEALIETLRQLGISRLQVHHLLGFPEGTPEFIHRLALMLDTGYEVMLHDYYFVCPRINLTTEEDEYCGEPDLAGCEACIATRSSYSGGVPVWLWRERAFRFLQDAQRVIAPDADVATRIKKYFPGLRVSVEPHEKNLGGFPSLHLPYDATSPLRIGVLGALSPIKGARVLEALVNDANRRNLPIEYILIGYSDYAPLNRKQERLTVTGSYREDMLESLLREHRLHMLFFPSVWPETYSYTLSHAFRYHIPPVAFDIGAQASRIRAQKTGQVLSLELAQQPVALNDALLTVLPSEKKEKKEAVSV